MVRSNIGTSTQLPHPVNEDHQIVYNDSSINYNNTLEISKNFAAMPNWQPPQLQRITRFWQFLDTELGGLPSVQTFQNAVI